MLEAPLVPDPLAVATLEISYAETKDGLIRGYFVYPESMVAPLPGIIMIHEWWGLNEPVKQSAAKLASAGYIVLAIDLFDGDDAIPHAQAAALSRRLLDDPAAADANIIAAHEFLRQAAGAPAVGVIGWSMGGYWSLKSTRLLEDKIAAAVVYYGQLDEDDEKIAAISAPVQALYAGDDRSIPPQTVRNFRERADALNKEIDVYIYPGVKHGFANPDDPRHDADTAAKAWARTFSFLEQHLKSGDSQIVVT